MLHIKPFQSLDPQEKAALQDPQNQEARDAYIDCLALLHDVLIELSSVPEHPRLGTPERIRTLFKESSQKLASSGKNTIQPIQAVYEKTLTNRESAFALREEIFSPSRTVVKSKTKQLIDTFLVEILAAYKDAR